MEYLKWILKYIDQIKETEASKQSAKQDSVRREIKNIDLRLKNLLELKISPKNDGGVLLSDEEFLAQKNNLMRNKITLESSLSNRTGLNEKVDKLAKKTFQFAAYAKYWFENGNPQGQRNILTGIGSNFEIIDKKLLISVKKPLIIIQKQFTGPDSEAKRFDRGIIGDMKHKNRLMKSGFCAKLGELEDVRTEIRKILFNSQEYSIYTKPLMNF